MLFVRQCADIDDAVITTGDCVKIVVGCLSSLTFQGRPRVSGFRPADRSYRAWHRSSAAAARRPERRPPTPALCAIPSRPSPYIPTPCAPGDRSGSSMELVTAPASVADVRYPAGDQRSRRAAAQRLEASSGFGNGHIAYVDQRLVGL